MSRIIRGKGPSKGKSARTKSFSKVGAKSTDKKKLIVLVMAVIAVIVTVATVCLVVFLPKLKNNGGAGPDIGGVYVPKKDRENNKDETEPNDDNPIETDEGIWITLKFIDQEQAFPTKEFNFVVGDKKYGCNKEMASALSVPVRVGDSVTMEENDDYYLIGEYVYPATKPKSLTLNYGYKKVILKAVDENGNELKEARLTSSGIRIDSNEVVITSDNTDKQYLFELQDYTFEPFIVNGNKGEFKAVGTYDSTKIMGTESLSYTIVDKDGRALKNLFLYTPVGGEGFSFTFGNQLYVSTQKATGSQITLTSSEGNTVIAQKFPLIVKESKIDFVNATFLCFEPDNSSNQIVLIKDCIEGAVVGAPANENVEGEEADKHYFDYLYGYGLDKNDELCFFSIKITTVGGTITAEKAQKTQKCTAYDKEENILKDDFFVSKSGVLIKTDSEGKLYAPLFLEESLSGWQYDFK